MNKRVLLLLIGLLFVFVGIIFISADSCWTYTSQSSGCTAANGCKWRNDSWSTSGWCEELSCWSLNTQSECSTTNVPGKNCSWHAGGLSYGCEKLNCGNLWGTNASACVNNSAGLNCQWSDYCYNSGYIPPGTSPPNCYQYTNQSSCLNSTGCAWGQCMERGCYSYTTNTTCAAAKDWNGKNCTWDSTQSSCNENGCWRYYNQSTCIDTGITKGLNCQWKYNSCQETYCYTWDYTNASACVNNSANLSCGWNTWGGNTCSTKDCWSYSAQADCQTQQNCLWKSYVTSGWCEQVECWNWDGWKGYNQSNCENNAYSLNCIWDGTNTTNGWCYKNVQSVGCSNKTTERDCMDTYYCWWQYTDWNNVSAGGTCNTPGSFGGTTTNTTILIDWNPGCYIFDMNSTDCNNIIGCNYTNSECVALSNDYGNNITANGLNCSYINNSNLCNTLPILSSCCAWQNGTCTSNKLSSSCRDQMQNPPVGASFCEDYNSYENQILCEQIAGDPWYMPCQWNSSTSKCGFKASDVFGNESYSLSKIDNKLNCESAGGKWINENYCEGNVSLPAGRCEYKFDEEDNCDKACFACELKNSEGGSVNSTNAKSACTGSRLGICEFTANTNAPNGIGYCKSKEQFRKGIAGDCDNICGDCSYKGIFNDNDTTKRPSYYCSNSKANSAGGGCKWIVDNSTATGGYCVNKGEKTCEDSCDKCNTQSDCSNTGRTAVSNQTGSCKWQGSTTTGSCVANIGEDVEICWDGTDNTNDNLIDCADPSCYANPSCGFVEGDCFGWTTQTTCNEHNSSCEWVIDKWGSWCDFKGSQCWKYNQNDSTCNVQSNCQWSNGTASAFCEKDWSNQDTCMGLNQSVCMATNASGCNWTVDNWCSGTGNGTSWCTTSGGWCDHVDFKPKDCWKYYSSLGCGNVSGCNWRTDQYSMPHCEVNWSANCWQYTDTTNCNASSNCIWDTQGGGGWCMNKADKCWSYGQSDCNSALGGRCYWQSWSSGGTGGGVTGSCQSVCWNETFNTANTCSASYGCAWKADSGWCEESAMQVCSNTSNYNNETSCKTTSGCKWKASGWCDPKNGGFSAGSVAGGGGVGGAMGGDCYKYDGNQTLCTNKSIINISCGWNVNPNPACDVNWATDCWRYSSTATGCNSTNNCWMKNDTWGAFCTNIADQCWQNQTLQNNVTVCSANYLCTNNSWGGCEPKCFSLNSDSCTNATYTGKCKYTTGWCNPKGMNDMFTGMEAGAPAPLGTDTCGESGMQASVDICGFGMKDMGDAYGFGMGVNNFENASVCNKEKLSSFIMGGGGAGGVQMPGSGGMERIGSGNDTIIVLVYLDTDGSRTGGCALSHNSSAVGYEFRFKYTSQWNANTSKATETFNVYKCEDSDWKAADIKLSAWKKKMCSDIGGPMIAVNKADLIKFPTLYDSTRDMGVYVATIGNTGNISSPTDSAGPGWITPGSVDFDIANAFAYGANTAKFEDILKKGFLQGEDCYNGIDDDNNGNIDCNDWGCQYSSNCTSKGVNAAGYVDTSTPLVTGVKIEEYPDSVLITYDTNKPTNGTLEWYGADSQCLNSTNGEPGMYIFPDIGIVKNDTIREYKLWHVASIYEGATKLNSSGFGTYNAPVANGVTSYYKLRVCDSNNKCAVSKCSSFRLPTTIIKCSYCNFVTRIKVPTGWNVSYDVNRNGAYEHVQGQVCGPNAGMKTNYSEVRKVNIKLAKSDGSTYIEFLNASLTKTGLNDKVRTISTAGDMIHSTTGNYVGLTSETRDKIINNLHPEICRIKIPVASGATCDTLYHCDDTGTNCVDRTSSATLISSADCIWNVPYCEFSTYKTSDAPGSTTTSSGGGGGGGAAGNTYIITEEEFNQGYTKSLAKGDRIRINISGENHYITLNGIDDAAINVTISSDPQKAVISVGGSKKFDVANDNYYDLSVQLNTILKNTVTNKPSKAEITVKSIHEKIAEATEEESVAGTGEVVGESEETKTETSAEQKSSTFVWIFIIIIGIVILISVGYWIKNRKN